jgi:hypothetical protein
MTGHAQTWLANHKNKLVNKPNLAVQKELFGYVTLGLNPLTITESLKGLTKKKDETFLQYMQRHVNGTKCLRGGVGNPDSCLAGAKIFADHANQLVDNKMLCVDLNWETTDPVKLFDQIVELLQRATDSTGENYVRKTPKRKRDNEVNTLKPKLHVTTNN